MRSRFEHPRQRRLRLESLEDRQLLAILALQAEPFVDQPPVISIIANQTTNEDTPLPSIPFTVSDPDNPPESLVVTAAATNPSLLSTLSVNGSGGDRSLRVVPAANVSGNTVISVSAFDGINTTTMSFLLTVQAVNDPPTVNPIPNITILEGQALGTIAVSYRDIDSSTVTLTRASSNTALVPLSGLVLTGTGTSRTLTISPTPGAIGTSVITITATDAEGASGSYSFQFTVNPRPLDPNADRVGLYVPAFSTFFLRDKQEGGDADHAFNYGVAGQGWVPITGDWDGDGTTTIGLYDPASGIFYLKNSLTGGDADITFWFGPRGAGWQPLVGDWNGDGIDTVGLYDPSTGRFFLQNDHTGGDAQIQLMFGLGSMGWQPIVGDWNGDGRDSVGLYDPSTSLFFLKNSLVIGPADLTFTFGVGGLGWQPIVGNWDGKGADSLGFYVPQSATFFLKHALGSGNADIAFQYGVGNQGWQPLLGVWQTASASPPAAAPVADVAAGLSQVNVSSINTAPTDISLSATTIAENEPAETIVGQFATTDPDPDDTFTYALVSGPGSTDNEAFTIDGEGNLLSADSFDYETKSVYSIRVRTTDSGSLWFEKTFTISVTNVNEKPINIGLSANSIPENLPTGTIVGQLFTIDPDIGERFSYALVTGVGDTDNASFTTDTVGSLRTAATFNYEVQSSYSIRVRATGEDGVWIERSLIVTVTNVNEGPTDLSLSAIEVPENQPAGTIVGMLATVDPDGPDRFHYTLVSGDGDMDNASFVIGDAGTLLTIASFDHEAKSSYSVRIRTTDDAGLWLEKAFTILVTDVNERPVDIGLSLSTIAENQPAGTVVGAFSSVDPDAHEAFTYVLTSGPGSTDNDRFTINATGELVTAGNVDYETKDSYSIRVRTTDSGSLWFEKVFTVLVMDINEAPTNVALSHASVPENQPTGTIVGMLVGADQDAGETFSYALVSGQGSTDNSAFTIDTDGYLLTAKPFNYETKSSYSIRVRTTSLGNLWFEKQLTVAVTDVNEVPTNLTLSNKSVPENQPSGVIVGTFSTSDPDAGDTFTYTLVSGSGGTDNASFAIDASGHLLAADTFNYEWKSSYSIRVRTTDSGGLWLDKAMTVAITDMADPPDTPGLYVPGNSVFFLKDQQALGTADHVFVYGAAGRGWQELVGDWDGDGADTPGMYDPATAMFFLTNRLGGGAADEVFQFGVAGQNWKPLVGDWNGDGHDSIGVYEPATSLFFLKNSFAAGAADEMVAFGVGGLGWQPIVGDWDGRPGDGIGLYEPATSLFFLKNTHTPGAAEEAFAFGVGSLGWVPLAGNWDGTPGDGVGFYVPTTGQWFLKNAHTSGPAEITFNYGVGGQGWRPLVGVWDAPVAAAPAAAPAPSDTAAPAAIQPAAADAALAALAAPSPLDDDPFGTLSGLRRRNG